ncbi:MAG: T9SS type A sorting domain-containing protein [Bacteroidia bacterium]|nr:T9SS type A sorting domain-containing protein [Bacteroidia bacterium]
MNESAKSASTISIVPNPVSDKIKIQVSQTNANSGIKSIEIYNTLGEKVYTSAETSRSNRETINVSTLNSGIYFLRVKTEDGMKAGKFVKE